MLDISRCPFPFPFATYPQFRFFALPLPRVVPFLSLRPTYDPPSLAAVLKHNFQATLVCPTRLSLSLSQCLLPPPSVEPDSSGLVHLAHPSRKLLVQSLREEVPRVQSQRSMIRST